MATALFGAPLLSATSGASAVGLLGAGGSFAPSAGTLFSGLGSIAKVGRIISGASTLTRLASTRQESAAEEAAAETKAALSRRNASVTQSQTEADIERQDRLRRLRLGANIAQGGASGVGRNFDILRDNALQEELDILKIKHQGQLQEEDFLLEADIQDNRAKNARKRGRIGVGSTLLSGASSIIN